MLNVAGMWHGTVTILFKIKKISDLKNKNILYLKSELLFLKIKRVMISISYL